MRNSIYVLLMLLISNFVFGQNAELTGKVTDAISNEPLIGVSVYVDSLVKANTNVNGEFSVSMTPGTHQISFRLLSYELSKQTILLTDGEKKSLNIKLKGTSTDLNTVVISAGKFEQRLEDVTVSMEVLKPKLIESRNVTNMEEAMEFIPGLTVIDGQANIREGSGWSYGAGSRVQILVDDLPQLTADANDAKWNFLPVENLEQVEVIKAAKEEELFIFNFDLMQIKP